LQQQPEQHQLGGGRGAIYLAKSDGRYVRTVIRGHLQIPTAVITLPQLGRFCFADAGTNAKIECADMDGKHREVIVIELIYSPTSLAVDEGKENRIYWADPKFHKVESVLPDGHFFESIHSSTGQ
uniref:Str_synth domain-containing protein n=1 Tax=Gongylonema pulchrum TaxID=637853 RepID=A0A183EWY7_9BILA